MSPLLVPPTPFTNYLFYFPTNYCPKKCLTNIPKKEIPTLDRTHKRPHCSSAWTDYKGTLQHKASTQKLTTTFTQGNMSYCTSGLWYNKTTRIPPSS